MFFIGNFSSFGKPSIKIPEYDKIIDTNTASKIHSNDEGIIIDVRSTNEYTHRHIKNAISIPVDEIRSRITELPSDKKIIFVCNSGNKTCTKAYQIVSDTGFDSNKLYKIDGGTNRWIQDGYPVE